MCTILTRQTKIIHLLGNQQKMNEQVNKVFLRQNVEGKLVNNCWFPYSSLNSTSLGFRQHNESQQFKYTNVCFGELQPN